MTKRVIYKSANSYQGKRMFNWYGLIGHPFSKQSALIDETNVYNYTYVAGFNNLHNKVSDDVWFDFSDRCYGAGELNFRTPGFRSMLASYIPGYESAAIIGMHQKLLKDSQSTLKMGTFILELPSTVKFLAAPLQLIANAKKTFKRGGYLSAMNVLGYHDRRALGLLTRKRCKTAEDRKRLHDILVKVRKGQKVPEQDYNWLSATKDVSNQHLAFTYGMMPILTDCQSVYETVRNRCMQDFSTKTIYSSKSKDINYSKVVNASGERKAGYYPHTGFTRGNIFVSGKVKCKISLTYRPKNDNAAGFAAYYACQNPFTVAWEKLPYSFVVDWFIPMKKFFQTLVFPSNVEIGEIWSSSKLTITASGNSASSFECAGNGNYQKCHGSFNFDFHDKKRVPISASSFTDAKRNLERSLGNLASYSYPTSLSMWLSSFEMLAQRFIR